MRLHFQKIAQALIDQNVTLITTLKKNMKPQQLEAFDQLMLRKRSINEPDNDQLKNIGNLEHSRHRSLSNYLLNISACLTAYSYQEK